MFELKPWQKVLFDLYELYNKEKWIIVKSRRQVGKSISLEGLLIWSSLKEKDSFSLFISPVIQQARKVYQDVCKIASELIKSNNSSLLEIEFTNGSVVKFGSAQQADSLRGYTIKGSGILMIDEATYISDDVFYQILVPTTNVNNSMVYVVSTPKFKKGFFFELFMKGQIDNPKVISIDWNQYDTSCFLDNETLEVYRQQLPKLAFKSEFLAEFIDGEGTVFSDFKSCVTEGKLNNALPLFIGIDWGSGSGQDDTAITIGQVINDKAYIDDIVTFNDKNANDTIDYINNMIKRFIYNGFKDISVCVEKNSLGAIFAQLLLDTLDYPEVTFSTFTTTNKSKNRIINQLCLLFEQNKIQIPNNQKLLTELSAYECVINGNGTAIYNAASGFHDDMIISTAICVNLLFNEV